ncbi:MAG: AraC family transcriptional regulator [Akkermansiaceae bacterium]|nr:AraC family transcriptional regulator [Akkermansiaceae bacterium]MCP5542901.1 AraC family transcriptional regulator [Akkermansiaceae bacterium]
MKRNPDDGGGAAGGLRISDVRAFFQCMPRAQFFAKNLDGRFIDANLGFAERCGFKSEAEIIGLSDADVFPPALAERYREGDLLVLSTGRPVLGIIELFPNPLGVPDWCETNKLPLVGPDGSVRGVCGSVRSYEGTRAALQPFLDLAPAADHIKKHYVERLDVRLLAELSGMSVRQFERRFQQTFRMNPRTYLIRMRVAVAAEILRATDRGATEIALEVGFYDHSDFSRQFRRFMGVSPTEYRVQGRRARG